MVVPIYNHASYVTQAVRTALDQGPWLREVVAVDDGSADGSAETLRAAFGDDPRLVLWSQPNVAPMPRSTRVCCGQRVMYSPF